MGGEHRATLELSKAWRDIDEEARKFVLEHLKEILPRGAMRDVLKELVEGKRRITLPGAVLPPDEVLGRDHVQVLRMLNGKAPRFRVEGVKPGQYRIAVPALPPAAQKDALQAEVKKVRDELKDLRETMKKLAERLSDLDK